MIRALEDLPLLGNGTNNRFERRALVNVAERAGIDFVDDLGEAPPDRTKILQTVRPEEPITVYTSWIVLPLDDERLD